MLLLWFLLVWSHFNYKYLVGVCWFRGCFPDLWFNCAFGTRIGLCGLFHSSGINGMESLACFSYSLSNITHYDVCFVWYTWGILHSWFVVVLTFGDFFEAMEAQPTLWHLVCVQVVIFAESVQIYGLSWNYVLLLPSLRLKLHFFVLVLKVESVIVWK